MNEMDCVIVDFKGQTYTWINTVIGIAERMINMKVTEINPTMYRLESDGSCLQYITAMISLADGGEILEIEAENKKDFYNENSRY